MKKKELQNLHQKSLTELTKMLNDLNQELIKDKFELQTGKLKNVHNVKTKRKLIARIMTIMTEKQLADEQKGAK